uniref:transmembrane protein 132E-like n=1 Tax=Myxine glutinosa TaxID=7769 RepID=UPI00358F5569
MCPQCASSYIACTFAPLPPYSLVFFFCLPPPRIWLWGRERGERGAGYAVVGLHFRCLLPGSIHHMDRNVGGHPQWTAVFCGQAPPIDGPLGQRGTYAKQVISPISNVVLGERILSVGSDRVFLRGLHSRPIASLQLRLTRWPARASDTKDGMEGSGPMIRATVQAFRTLNQPAQEALVLSWLAFSDGTTSFLGHFPASAYDLSLASLDDRVVESVLGGANAIVAARGEGQGTFIRTELLLPESCRNLRRHEVFLHTPVRIRVMYTGDDVDIVHNVHGVENFADSNTEGKAEHIHLPWSHSDVQTPSFPAQTPRREASQPPVSTPHPIAPWREPLVPLSVPRDTSEVSFPVEEPSWGAAGPHPLDLDEDYPFGSPSDNSKPTPNAPEAGLTDVQVGLSTLLGVSGLALLLFAANCLVFGLRRQRRWRRQRRGAAGDAGGPGSHEATAPHEPPTRNSPPVSLWTVEGNRRLHPHGFAELAL